LMGGDQRTDNRVQEVSHISRSLKILARELNIPVLAAAQLSRAVEQRSDKKPVLSDLRESGCLAGETLVALGNGKNVSIRELEGMKDFVIQALNPETYKLEIMPVSKAFSTGVKPVFKLVTRLGSEIRATGNHKFLTSDGWKRLDELNMGEHLAAPRSLVMNDHEQTISDAEFALLGHLRGMTTRQMQAEIKTPNYGSGLSERNVSRGGASCVALVVQPQESNNLSASDVYWDTIVSIEPDGKEDVFDLTVPGYHNFVANNIIVHNSLEQDADIVMFIYRPDQYEKDTVKQNVAEIIVAKHRNGPVGSVELVFRGEQAKFENAATRVFKPNE